MSAPGGGTVYGKGGLDARPPRDGRFAGVHPALTAAVALGVVAVFALGWFVWRGTATPDTLRDLNDSAAGAAVPAGPSATAAATPAAADEPVQLAVGAYRLESAASPGALVSIQNNLAVLTADAGPLDVVQGLAKAACFSFRADDGRYLRHSGYRLRFDPADGSTLFREDATFCPEEGAEPGTVTLRSVNYPGHVVHHRGVELWIDEPDGSGDFAGTSSFAVREG